MGILDQFRYFRRRKGGEWFCVRPQDVSGFGFPSDWRRSLQMRTRVSLYWDVNLGVM